MAHQWHYSKNGEKHGPVPGSELKELAKSGILTSSDLVWRDDWNEWKPASSVKGLFAEQSVAGPPPLPKTQPNPGTKALDAVAPLWEQSKSTAQEKLFPFVRGKALDVIRWCQRDRRNTLIATGAVACIAIFIMCAGVGSLSESALTKRVRALPAGPNEEPSLGMVLDAVCDSPSWEDTIVERKNPDGNDVVWTKAVQFSGGMGGKVVTMQWILEGDEPKIHSMEVEGEMQNPFAAMMFIVAANVKYEEMNSD